MQNSLSPPFLKTANLTKTFGPIRALQDINFSLEKGTLTIFAGPDGAGKSTLFKSLIGLVKKDSGTIFLDGKSLEDNFSPINSICGYMPERFSLYTDLSVEENLNFFADIYQVAPKRKAALKNKLLKKTGMDPFRKRRAGALSGGMKQKLALASILLSSPELIILDEPTTGVDPMSRIEFYEIIKELQHEGRTILISTPYLDEAEKGDRIIFMQAGRILKQGAISEIKRNFPVKVFRILPRGRIFETLDSLKKYPQLSQDLFIRGRFLKYLETGNSTLKNHIPAIEINEVEPTLEDIYLYYERKGYGDIPEN